MFIRAKWFLAAASTCVAFAVLAPADDASACGLPPAERVARDAVERGWPGVVVRDAILTETDGKRATVRVVGGHDGKNVVLLARLANDGDEGWRVVSLAPVATKLRKLKPSKS
jgi:hypothetical protein